MTANVPQVRSYSRFFLSRRWLFLLLCLRDVKRDRGRSEAEMVIHDQLVRVLSGGTVTHYDHVLEVTIKTKDGMCELDVLFVGTIVLAHEVAKEKNGAL